MARLLEIKVPETEPATEWVNGRALQKVSPKRAHALAQGAFAMALGIWAREHGAGTVGPEWRFAVEPPSEVRRPLVPDVAFLSYKRMPYAKQLVTEVPRIAPDVVVEILSPGDRKKDIEEKTRVYLRAGTSVVFLVDPKLRNVTVCELGKRRVIHEDGNLEHAALPAFKLAVIDLFTPPQPKG